MSVFNENLGQHEILDELIVNLPVLDLQELFMSSFFGIALVLARVREITRIFRHALDLGDWEWEMRMQWLICIGAGMVGMDGGGDMDRGRGYGITFEMG